MAKREAFLKRPEIVLFGARNSVRPARQRQGPFRWLQGIDWLFDSSFGMGKLADRWPSLTSKIPFFGHSGGLGPDTGTIWSPVLVQPGS